MTISKPTTVNDIHSQLNRTEVTEIIAPKSIAEAQEAVARVRDAGLSLSIAAGRHAMGGQQFLWGGTMLDTRRLNRIVGLDAERGIATVEAGIMWSDLVRGLSEMQADAGRGWSVVQKQTGADRLSIGGALAANGHGRGLTYRPIVQDIEAFQLIDANGKLIQCDREQNRELFNLAIGGYGLFGVISTVDCASCPRITCAGSWKSPPSTSLKLVSKNGSRTVSPTATSSTAPMRTRPDSFGTACCPAIDP